MTGLDWMYMKPQHPATPPSTTSRPAPSTRAHPGHEVPWDSPIESAAHPLDDHLHHLHHLHENHLSGASTPHSHASPGLEEPWDSPILEAETPHTPLSDMDEKADYLSHEAVAACFSGIAAGTAPQPTVLADGKTRQSKPMQKAAVHPPLGSSNGHFGKQQQHGVCPGCELRDSASREEFLWHISGVCGCGRQAVMTAVMTPLRERRDSFCERH